MKLMTLLLNLVLAFAVLAEVPQLVPGLTSVEVFTPEKDGYPHFRIPAIVTSQEGTVLVFAEGRQITDDHARNDIVLKRSEDNGQTWSDTIIIHENPELVMVNPSPVVLDSGRIILFYETFPHGLHARNGRHFDMMDDGYDEGRTQRLLMRTSDDDGRTWSEARDLTKISREAQDIISSGSPANGIQLQRGEYKGRILMPLFLTRKIDENKRTWLNAALYSDDGGETWTRSQYVPIESTEPCNEVTIVELDNGDVMLNARPNKAKMRCVSVSKDGGENWSPYKYDPVLAGRTCNTGILRYSYENPSRLIFLNNNNNSQTRMNGTIRVSYNNGTTWDVSKQVVPGLFGYSQICKLRDGSVGVIFEPFSTVRETWNLCFLRLPIEWIEAPPEPIVAEDGFENAAPGPFTKLTAPEGEWTTVEGHAQINTANAEFGQSCLHIIGGNNHSAELQLPEKAMGKVLQFKAERWTRKEPFEFRISGLIAGEWTELYDGDRKIRIGGFKTKGSIALPDGTERLRFSCTAPANAGVLIDEVKIIAK